MTSVIVPTYNESNVIADCLRSLFKQTVRDMEIIVVDDGSTDDTTQVVSQTAMLSKGTKVHFYKRKHRGPGEARNFGAKRSTGKILVFVDADMTFDRHFVEKLTLPLRSGTVIGSDTQDAYLSNSENFWALSWNIGRFYSVRARDGDPSIEMIPNKSDFGGVFRAILRKEFMRVGGFSKGGDYSDDVSLYKKLKKKAYLAKGAKYFHKNPDTIVDVWNRAVWIGGDRNFSPNFLAKIFNLVRFFPLLAIPKSVPVIIQYRYVPFVLFKIVYDTAIFWAVLKNL